MKNNFKKYVETGFDKIKQSATQFVSEKQEPEEEEPSIELDPADYERLRQKAARQHTTVQQLLNQAIRNLLEDRQPGYAPAITERQREANPLLLLDALTDKHETDLAFRSHAPVKDRTGIEEGV